MMGAKHILVVDDELPVREWLTDVLEEAGYRVSCAVDGQDALERLPTLAPDALILDIMMPRLDGYSVLATLRTQQYTLPIIVLTASRRADVMAIQSLGADAWLHKPIDGAWLLERVEAHLGPAACECSG